MKQNYVTLDNGIVTILSTAFNLQNTNNTPYCIHEPQVHFLNVASLVNKKNVIYSFLYIFIGDDKCLSLFKHLP